MRIDAKDRGGVTPLSRAADAGNAKVASLLLAHGANPNSRDNGGGTPLHGAAWKGREEAIRLLIARGADVNAKDNDGMTPVWFATKAGQRQIADLLSRHGAGSYVCDLCGRSFNRSQLDKHFEKTAKQSAKLAGVTWSGKLVTFDDAEKAWCPHCFKDAKSMRGGRRTVHSGGRELYLPPPNLGVSYKCECGRYKIFNCLSVNVLTGLELACGDCGAVLFVPPTIFDHSKPPQHGGASLRPDYQDRMTFIRYKMRELHEQLRQGLISEDEHKKELERRGFL